MVYREWSRGELRCRRKERRRRVERAKRRRTLRQQRQRRRTRVNRPNQAPPRSHLPKAMLSHQALNRKRNQNNPNPQNHLVSHHKSVPLHLPIPLPRPVHHRKTRPTSDLRKGRSRNANVTLILRSLRHHPPPPLPLRHLVLDLLPC
jgi:hypothetical protein